MSRRALNGSKICGAVSDSTRLEILQNLIRSYPKPQTITDIERALSKRVSPTTISFHLRKLREAGLITTNGHKMGFRAVHQTVGIKINNNGVRVEEVR